jgi:hypothetical protein
VAAHGGSTRRQHKEAAQGGSTRRQHKEAGDRAARPGIFLSKIFPGLASPRQGERDEDAEGGGERKGGRGKSGRERGKG